MKYLSIVLFILLCGCTYDVPSYKIENAQKACKSHDGVYSITVFGRSIGVTCNDGLFIDCLDLSSYKETK